MKRVFLCHAGEDAGEIRSLAEELKLRGVAPWVDKDGGFKVGDESAGEAERAIDEDCLGFLFYATPRAFESDFIRQVEARRALRRREEDPSFALFAVPRGMGFGELSRRSINAVGVDLAGRCLPEGLGEDGAALRASPRKRPAPVVGRAMQAVPIARLPGSTPERAPRHCEPPSACSERVVCNGL